MVDNLRFHKFAVGAIIAAVEPESCYTDLREVVVGRVKMVCYRCVFSIGDAVSVFSESFVKGSVGFPYIHFLAQAAGDQVDNIVALAVEFGFDEECFAGWALE